MSKYLFAALYSLAEFDLSIGRLEENHMSKHHKGWRRGRSFSLVHDSNFAKMAGDEDGKLECRLKCTALLRWSIAKTSHKDCR